MLFSLVLNTILKLQESLIQVFAFFYHLIRCSFVHQSLLHLLAAELGAIWLSYKYFIAGVNWKTVISPSCFCTRERWDNTSLEQQSNFFYCVCISGVSLPAKCLLLVQRPLVLAFHESSCYCRAIRPTVMCTLWSSR